MRIYIAILGTGCLLFSCTNAEKSESKAPSKEIWEKSALAYLASESNLISFGALRIDKMLTKAIYNSKLSESGLVPLDMIKDYSEVIYTELPMYYAVKSNLKDITSTEVVVVCKIKSASLAIETMKKDFQIGEIIEENGVKFLFTSDIKIGLTDNEMIFFMSENIDNKLAQEAIQNTIDGLKSKKTNSEIAQTIAAKDDITFALNIEQIQKSLNTAMGAEALEPSEKLKGTIAMHLSFEEGKIVLTNKNYLPKQVLGLNIFAENSKAMLGKLGAGSPIAAVTLSFDIQGFEKFQKQYLPKSISNIIQDSDLSASIKKIVPRELSIIEAFIQKDGVQNYVDGNLAYGEYIIEEKYREYSAYIGIGPGLEEILKNEFNPMKGFFHSLEINDTRMALYTSEVNGPQNKTNTLQLKSKFKDLGEKPISAFVDIERYPYKVLLENTKVTERIINLFKLITFNANLKEEKLIFRLLRNEKVNERIVDLFKHITLNADLNGGKLIITMKDEQENSMTQIANLIPSLILGSIFQ